MWAMEYNPNMFAINELPLDDTSSSLSSLNPKDGNELRKYGKYEKVSVQNDDHHYPLSVFLVAGVLEARSKRLLKETKGLDDVVKILNDITGNLDAKKACKEALKVQKKYLNKAKVS